MVSIKNFFNYINESIAKGEKFSEQNLNDLLTPINDLGIDVFIDKKDGLIKTMTKGDFIGSGYIKITFTLNKLKFYSDIDVFGVMISDNKFWEFLDEFITFKNRLESEKVYCHFNMNNYGIVNPSFSLIFIVSDYKSDIIELEKAFDILSRRVRNGSSDFLSNTYIQLDRENKELYIKSHVFYYTDRKLNNLINLIDKDKLNISEKEYVSIGNNNREPNYVSVKLTVK